MWCKNCNIETNEEICPICQQKTDEVVSVEVFWCDKCNIPIIVELNQANKNVCPICGHNIKFLATDIRPVFPEERLLLELLLKKEPHIYLKDSIWASNNRYYIQGKPIVMSNQIYQEANIDKLIVQLEEHKNNNSYEYFNHYVYKFIDANKNRLYYLKDEAYSFIHEASKNFAEEHIVLSFSGGKDSTVTADLVIKALSNPSLVHIFGDTTLEFPLTIEYANRYRQNHLNAIFQIARNNEQNFMDVCKDIGPPARMMRWCCSMFKTGPITRVINSLYRNQRILTFYGVRRAESVSRSKYNRIEDDAESVKIQQQTVASPIFFWKDIDIWLYIFYEGIDFNDAYRLGYDRVGCWCCPNNNIRAQFLSKIYMPEQSAEWRNFLINFARQIGKPDAENYVDNGMWKARQGGNGLRSANDIKLKFSNCTSEEFAKIYQLTHEMNDDLIGMLSPFGEITHDLGQKLLNEVIVLDKHTKVPIISIQPFGKEGYEYSVKIKTMNVSDHDNLQRMIGYQIRKFNACRKCLKCESLCQAGAISIRGDRYQINENKCIQCKMCVSSKYLSGGCMMDKYLRTK